MKGDDDIQKRKTKKDKAKRNFNLYGKYTPKHVRKTEELQEKHRENSIINKSKKRRRKINK